MHLQQVRFITLLSLAACGAFPAAAAEYCVVCTAPQASYRCMTSDRPTDGGTDSRDWMLCVQELSKTGGHESCAIDRQQGAPCAGEVRNIRTQDIGDVLPPDVAAPAAPLPAGVNPSGHQQAPAVTAPPSDAAGLPVPQPPGQDAAPAEPKGGLEKAWDCMSSLFKKC